MKRIVILTLVLSLVLALGSLAFLDKPLDKDKLLEESLDELLTAKNYSFKYDFFAQAKDQLSIFSEGVVRNKPLEFSMETKFKKNEEEYSLSNYGKKEEENIYLQEVFEGDSHEDYLSLEDFYERMQFFPSRFLEKYAEHILEKSFLEENKDYYLYKLILEDSFYEKNFSSAYLKEAQGSFKNIESLLFINKKSLEIEKISIDLKGNLKRLGDFFQEKNIYEDELLENFFLEEFFFSYEFFELNKSKVIK